MFACAGLVLAAVIVYSNSFSGPFIFDDLASIPENSTIRHFATALSPPGGGQTVTSRPVLNLTFALNYALGGERVWGYHAVNLLIHVLAGLTLFGIIRRTLAARRAAADATLTAFFVALLWSVHPLQTESVTYMVQRAESLMGLFYLLTLYCFIRGAEEEKGRGAAPRGWFALAFVSCLLGMCAKEVMVSAPVIVLLYDRTFLAGSFRAAWQHRRSVFLWLASTWLPLAGLVLHGANRGGSAGFGVAISFWEYIATQFLAVAHYLWLVIWPRPLILDYGAQVATSLWEVVPYAVVVAFLVAATAWALVRRPVLGFMGAWFFAILAPTSLVAVVRQTLAEHRMYLALAPVIVLLILALQSLLGRRAWQIVAVIAAVCFAGLTFARNTDYRSDEAILVDTVAKRPGNAAAQNNLGNVLAHSNRAEAAIPYYDAALRIKPDYADVHFNAGNALTKLGRLPEAVAHYAEAVRLEPNFADAHNGLGVVLGLEGRLPEAIDQLEQAVRIDPAQPDSRRNLGDVLRMSGRLPEALTQYEEAVRLAPGSSQAHCNLGNALREADRLPEAVAQYELGVQLDPGQPSAQNDLGIVELMSGRTQDAIAHFEKALQLDPGLAQVHLNLAAALTSAGRSVDAASQTEAARRLGAKIPALQN